MNLLDHVLNIRMLIHRSFNGKMERIGIGVSQYEERPGLSAEDVALRSRIIDINNTHHVHTLSQTMQTLASDGVNFLMLNFQRL